MADKKISELDAASSAAVADQVVLLQSGTTKRATITTLGDVVSLLGTAQVRTADLTLNDDVKVTLGTGGDADLYYDGTDVILDPQVAGSGDVKLNAGNLALGDDQQLQLGTAPDYWWEYESGNTRLRLRSSDIDGGGTDGDILRVADGGQAIEFVGSVASPLNLGGSDLQLHRDAADTLAQRRSTNAQEFRVYEQFTSSSDFRRLALRFDGGNLEFQLEGQGQAGRAVNFLSYSGTQQFAFSDVGIGFFGTPAAAQAAAYTPTNVSTDRAYDANSTTTAELADVLGTLIADLQSYGLLQ